jgi:CheY-like chemotaxis protein
MSRVLVVEDNAVNQKVIVKSLARLNLDCDVANNGDIGVEMYRLQSTRYALILMDICMPVKDGLVATREIRAFESENHLGHIPIVALSAQVLDQDRDACALAGMDAFLEKPVRFANLRNLLNPIFAQNPLYRAILD